MKTKKTCLTYSQAATVREKGRKVGKKYCSHWQIKGGRKGPECKVCQLVEFGLDCHKNPIGYRDFLIAGERAKMIAAFLAIEPRQIELAVGTG